MLDVQFIDYIEDEKIEYVTLVARHEGKWLWCRHEGRDTWELPGGHREKGESLEEAARRELYEETGAEEYTLYPVGTYYVKGKTPYQGENDISYGMLYKTEVKTLGTKPTSEIEEVRAAAEIPGGWAYPEIQPQLVEKVSKHIIKGVPFISQLIKYPTGCESVSAVMALQYLGYDITPETFMDELLPRGAETKKAEDGLYYGCDPWEAFPGDPYTVDGWGCFAPVILKAMEKLPEFEATAYYGWSIDELCSCFIDRDIPVLFWATIDMAPPRHSIDWYTETGKKIEWVNPMHCLLLIGYDEKGYIFNDPTGGELAYYSKEVVETAYVAQGKQAVTIGRRNAK